MLLGRFKIDSTDKHPRQWKALSLKSAWVCCRLCFFRHMAEKFLLQILHIWLRVKLREIKLAVGKQIAGVNGSQCFYIFIFSQICRGINLFQLNWLLIANIFSKSHKLGIYYKISRKVRAILHNFIANIKTFCARKITKKFFFLNNLKRNWNVLQGNLVIYLYVCFCYITRKIK